MPKIVDHEARRAEITAVAVDLIAEGGLEAATIREIASQSGYSKGVVEHYFDNKEELISAALAQINSQYMARAQAASEDYRGLAAIKQCLRITLPLTPELRKEWRVRLVFWSMATTDEVLKKQQGERFQRAAELFARHFEQAFEDGEIERYGSAMELGRRLVHMVSGMAVAALHSDTFGEQQFLEDEIDYLATVMSRGFNYD